MKTTLEKPIKKTAPAGPAARTPFIEKEGTRKGAVLGNPRWQTPPSIPSRERCQSILGWQEKEDGEAIIEAYRANEKLANDNDLGARQFALADTNVFRILTPLRRQILQKECLECDNEKFEQAQHELRLLREEAAVLAKRILVKLIDSFDQELQATAIEAEKRLEEAGIPLCNQGDWTLWHSPECDYRHSWRETTRHKLLQFDHSANDIAIGCIQWLCTSEEGTPFRWLA